MLIKDIQRLFVRGDDDFEMTGVLSLGDVPISLTY
jgi:hypothetical protein